MSIEPKPTEFNSDRKQNLISRDAVVPQRLMVLEMKFLILKPTANSSIRQYTVRERFDSGKYYTLLHDLN